MSENVFDQNNLNNDSNVAPPPSNDPFGDKLKGIVDKDGRPKYASTDKALEALVHSQAHIERLEQEAAQRAVELEEARRKAAEAEALEAVIERLKPNNSPEQKVTPPNAGVDEAATIAQLEKILEKRELAKLAGDNLKSVNDVLITKFGSPEKAKEAVAVKAAELGMTVQELGSLSAKSPKAALQFFGEAPKAPQSTPPSNNTPLIPLKDDEGLKPPAKSLLLGATSKEQTDYMKKIKEDVWKRHNITE